MSGRAFEPIAAAAPKIFVAFLSIVCFAVLWRVVATIGLHVPFDPNEGWNAYHAAAAITGHALYPDAGGYMVNNYPPLSFYIVGALGGLSHDMIVAGRYVSLFSFFAVAAGIAQAARMTGCRERDAAIAALLFMACLLVSSDYVGMDDPQLLGHALGIAGMLLVLREPRERSAIAGAAVLVLALFVKHNLVAQPIALAIWLFVYDRRAAWRFIATGAALSLAGLLAFRLGFGSNLLAHLASARIYDWTLLEDLLGNWLVWGAVPLGVVAILTIVRNTDKAVIFCALYAAIALAFGIAFAGGAGVDTNVFFDADIALSLGCGVAFHRLSQQGVLWPAILALALAVPPAVGVYRASDENWYDPDYWFHPMSDDAATARADIAFLASRDGPVLCEMLSLCYWAGKPAEVDLFNTEQQFLTHARSDDELARAIRARRFSAIELDALNPFPLMPRIRAALLAAYRIDHSDDEGVFFVPR